MENVRTGREVEVTEYLLSVYMIRQYQKQTHQCL